MSLRGHLYLHRFAHLCILAALLTTTACRRAFRASNDVGKEATEAEIKEFGARHQRSALQQQAWYRTNVLGAYLTVGQHDPRWDESVTNALRLIAQLRTGNLSEEGARNEIHAALTSAIEKGCADPFVHYGAIRYSIDNLDRVDPKVANQFLVPIRGLRDSNYPASVRFWANLQGRKMNGKTRENWGEYLGFHERAGTCLVEMLEDPQVPISEIQLAVNQLLDTANFLKPPDFESTWKPIEKTLFARFGKTYQAHLLKGRYHYDIAWLHRGTGFVDSVSKDGWKNFEAHLKKAHDAFDQAWEIDPTISATAVWMIKLANCESAPREVMETWFRRAMKLNPANYNACDAKLWYISAWWHGSAEEMIQFGRECVQNTNYTGNIPMIQLDAYSQLYTHNPDKANRAEMYKEPQVWEDVRAAITEMERRQPGRDWYYNNLAWYAWKCERWKELNQTLAKINNPDYAYFGGEEQYRMMLVDARAHPDN